MGPRNDWFINIVNDECIENWGAQWQNHTSDKIHNDWLLCIWMQILRAGSKSDKLSSKTWERRRRMNWKESKVQWFIFVTSRWHPTHSRTPNHTRQHSRVPRPVREADLVVLVDLYMKKFVPFQTRLCDVSLLRNPSLLCCTLRNWKFCILIRNWP